MFDEKNISTVPGVSERSSKPLTARLLKLAEVAAILGVCSRSVSRAIDRGELPKPVRVGRSVRLFESDVLAYLQRLREQRGGVA